MDTKNYKCLYGIKELIYNVNNKIDDNDIVIRIRSDLHINNFNNLDLTILFNKVTNDSYFFVQKKRVVILVIGLVYLHLVLLRKYGL